MADGKRCAKCGETKPTSEFSKHKGWRDGLFPYCRSCKRAVDRADWAKHSEKRRPARDAYYAANSDAIKAKARQRYRDNPEVAKRRATAWQAANPDKARQYKAKWVKDNLAGAVRENTRRRYARRHGAVTIKFTPEQLAAKVAYWGGRCWVCGAPFQAIDHVKPLVVGGPHILANLRPICTSCNSRKRASWPLPKGVPMVHSPSKRWEDGVLAERAISTNEPGDPVPDDGVSGTKPYKTPVPTTHSPEEREAQRAAAKAVQAAENKSVEPEATTTKAKRKK